MFDLSRFIQIYDGILLEYVYTDHSNPESYTTAELPIEMMSDAYTNGRYLFNPPAYESITGNTRKSSSAAIEAGRQRYASLTTAKSITYNDTDPNLTPSNSLEQTFSPALNVEYDTIRYHFAAGFDFMGFDGFIFDLTVQRRDSLDINLSSYTFTKLSSPTLNPQPFLLGERLYSTYIELKVPSTYFMLQEFYSNPANTNGLGYKFTEGKGFIKTTTIDCSARGIISTETVNGFPIYRVKTLSRASLDASDQFQGLSATVVEASGGDYFELYGEYNGQIYDNFMASLNAQPNSSWIVFHNVTTLEQIGTTFVKTAEQAFIQEDDFDLPTNFRPIVMNSASAVAFAIDYTMRIYNRANNSQIIRKSRLISNQVGKYGRRLQKLNIGTVPTVVKVYNELPQDNGSNIVIGDSLQVTVNQNQPAVAAPSVPPVQTQVVTVAVFRDRGTVLSRISPVNLNVTEQNSTE
jgi:hypothetical protein